MGSDRVRVVINRVLFSKEVCVRFRDVFQARIYPFSGDVDEQFAEVIEEGGKRLSPVDVLG